MGAKKTKKTSGSGENAATAVVSKPFQPNTLGNVPVLKRLPPAARIATVIVGAVVIVLLAVAAWHFIHPTKVVLPTPLPADIDTDYSTTSVKNFPVLLAHDYDLTEKAITTGNLNRELKNFDMAHNVAIVLYRQHDINRSIAAYKIAISKAPKNSDYGLYKEVMIVAYEAHNDSYGAQLYAKAAEAIQHSSLSDTDKQAALNSLNLARTAAKEGS